jgi:hypothetical protein
MLNKLNSIANLINKDSWQLDVATINNEVLYKSEVFLIQDISSSVNYTQLIKGGLLFSKQYPFNQIARKFKGTALQSFSCPPKA